MDAIQAARELGKAIQQDERYITMMLAQQKSDEDDGLQTMIETFNHKRMALNGELSNPQRDNDKVQALDNELKSMYQEIFQNEHMIAFTQAKSEVDEMMSFVNQIVAGSTQGMDPDEIEYQESCGGDCGGCSGCH